MIESNMTLYELIALSSSIGFRIDAQWGFFLTVHMALFGGIIYVDRPLRKTEKVIAIFLYSGFAFINYFVLSNQLALLQHIYIEISTNFADVQSSLVEYFVQRSKAEWFSQAELYSRAVHLLMLVIVSFSIIYDKEH